jgi:hypothetical protein
LGVTGLCETGTGLFRFFPTLVPPKRIDRGDDAARAGAAGGRGEGEAAGELREGMVGCGREGACMMSTKEGWGAKSTGEEQETEAEHQQWWGDGKHPGLNVVCCCDMVWFVPLLSSPSSSLSPGGAPRGHPARDSAAAQREGPAGPAPKRAGRAAGHPRHPHRGRSRRWCVCWCVFGGKGGWWWWWWWWWWAFVGCAGGCVRWLLWRAGWMSAGVIGCLCVCMNA